MQLMVFQYNEWFALILSKLRRKLKAGESTLKNLSD